MTSDRPEMPVPDGVQDPTTPPHAPAPSARLRQLVERRSWWFLAPLLTPLVVFADALAGRRLLAPGDGGNLFLPLHLLVARIFRAGDLPGWNPFSFSGSALLASAQAGVFYPPNLAFLFLSPTLANNVTVVISFVIAGTGAYAFTRQLSADPAGAAVAGLVFALSGFMFGHIGHQNMIASLAWLPWAFLGFEMLRQRISALRLLGAGAALALVLLAGHPQMLSIALMALGVYAVALSILDRRTSVVRPLWILALMVGIALALAAVQLLPTAAILDVSDRSTLSFEAATTYSFSETHLALLIFPYLFGNTIPLVPFDVAYQGAFETNLTELAGYPGAAALCLAAAGLSTVRRDRRVAGLLVAAVVALLIALGSSTPLGGLIYDLPIYGQFRSWGRFVGVVDLAVAVLAGFGVSRLRGADRRQRRSAAVAAAVAAGFIVLAAAIIPLMTALRPFRVEGRALVLALVIPAGFAVAGAMLCAAATRVRATTAVAVLACVLVSADALFSFGAFYEWRAERPPAAMQRVIDPGVAPAWGEVPDAPGGVDRYLVGSLDVAAVSTYVNATVAKGLFSANGFEPLAPDSYIDRVGGMTYYGGITRPEDLWRPGTDLLDLLRVSVVLVTDDTDPRPPGGSLLGRGVYVPDLSITRYDYEPVLPEAFVVGAVELRTATAVTEAIVGHRDFDPRRQVLVEEPCSGCDNMTEPGPAGTATATRPGTQGIDVEVQAERASMLVVSEAWFPGWTATVDGEEVEVRRADGLLLGVPLGAGAHRVELRYSAPGLPVGAVISVATVVLLAGGALLESGRRRRSSRPD